ncbi:SIMPL domain-containing protein [Hansschlegelia quercus]|nr:SIMPL domain-containing protein [Hansschlegelia quercus]
MAMRLIIGIAATGALASCLLAPAFASAQEPAARPSVTVSGEGTASAAPDRALLTSGVVTRAPSAAAALKANAAAMTKTLAAIKQAGIEDRDVGTSGLSVQPQYDYGDGQGGQRTPKLVGYEVRNTVSIRARNVAGVGDLVDAVVNAGSNQIDGLVFDVADADAKLDEARRAAMADARRKAELYAAGAGAKLGAPLMIEEQGGAPEPVRPMTMRAKALDVPAPATPIAQGEQELTVRVTVKWELAP